MNSQSIRIADRDVLVEVTSEAKSELAGRNRPVVVEMELYFSCLIRKRVRFPEAVRPDAFCQTMDGGMTICFRPVMTRACAVKDVIDKPDLEAFPIAKPQAFVPRWLRIDYLNGNWSGEFGY